MNRNSDFINEYIKAVKSRQKALDKGDANKANEYYDKVMKILDTIKQSKEGIESLSNLLSYDDFSVRLSAATHLLNYKSDIAENVLNEIVNLKKPGLSFTAKMVIKEWKKGNLKF